MRIATANETYFADEALIRTRTQWAWIAVLAIGLVAAPFALNNYWLYLACLVAINVASATASTPIHAHWVRVWISASSAK